MYKFSSSTEGDSRSKAVSQIRDQEKSLYEQLDALGEPQKADRTLFQENKIDYADEEAGKKFQILIQLIDLKYRQLGVIEDEVYLQGIRDQILKLERQVDDLMRPFARPVEEYKNYPLGLHRFPGNLYEISQDGKWAKFEFDKMWGNYLKDKPWLRRFKLPSDDYMRRQSFQPMTFKKDEGDWEHSKDEVFEKQLKDKKITAVSASGQNWYLRII